MPPNPSLVGPPLLTEKHEDLRRGVREVCSRFPNEYWRGLDEERRYPEEFVAAMTGAGYLGALIPEAYGGMGLDLSAACAILEEVNRSGANAGPAHAQMYTMGTLLRHGSEEQKREYLPGTVGFPPCLGRMQLCTRYSSLGNLQGDNKVSA
jgi:alkylation response protein AidB-like acyl-CoA dehydrogenase